MWHRRSRDYNWCGGSEWVKRYSLGSADVTSQATDIRSHKAGGGDGAGQAVACDWLVGESNNYVHVA